MLSTPFTWVSIGAATACATVAASAPGKLADTVTVGGAIGGYCSMGSPTRAARPASVTTIDRTLAKIGRRMQKSEITDGCSESARGGGLACSGRRLPRFDRLHRHARCELEAAVDDDALAVREADWQSATCRPPAGRP